MSKRKTPEEWELGDCWIWMVEDLNDPLPRSNNDQSIQVQFDKYHETYSDIAIEHLNDLKEFLKKVFLRKSTQKMTQIPAKSTYINVRSDDSWIWMIEDDFNNAFPSSKNDLSIQIQFDNNIETRSDIVIERVALKEFLEKVFPKKLRTVVAPNGPDITSWLENFIKNSESTDEYTSKTLHYHYNIYCVEQNLPVIPTARSFGMIFKNRIELAKWGIVRRRSHGQGYYRFNKPAV